MQGADTLTPNEIEFTCVSDVKPTAEQLEDLKFAWLCVKHVKSNAITVAKAGKLLGMGSGQPNRVKSVQIALEKAVAEIKASARGGTACLLVCPVSISPGAIFSLSSHFTISMPQLVSCVQGSVLASDAFFPFSWNDSVEIACQAGVAAIVHPGGSVRDQDAVDCCNKYGVALLTTGVRHFKH